MQTIPHHFVDVSCHYPLQQIAPEEEILLIDIETTGFSAHTSCLYMIGCLYMEDGHYHTIQWFADSYAEEEQILDSFFRFSKPYHYLIHFNGLQFDLPYLKKKAEKYHLSCPLDSLESIDLYKRISPYKKILALDNLKQKSIEAFLKLDRKDCYNGGELISIYHEYVKSPTSYQCDLLLLHNFEDLKGMLLILPILTYDDLFHTKLPIKYARINTYQDIHGAAQKELLMAFTSEQTVPVSFSYSINDCRILCEEHTVTLRVPLIHACLKYFLPNHKDYFYLPLEDTAIHKSVAAYVDKAHRIPATLMTCYTKKEADFLPQWNAEFTPAFKTDYRDFASYFVFEPTLLKEPDLIQKYAADVLQMFCRAHA